MKKVRVVAPNVPEMPNGTWSNCIRVGDFVYLSGMTARTSAGTIEGEDEYAQAIVIYAKIAELLRAAGGSIDDVVSQTTFVIDATQKEKLARARREVFSEPFPASALVEVKGFALPRALVEIQAIACIGSSRASG